MRRVRPFLFECLESRLFLASDVALAADQVMTVTANVSSADLQPNLGREFDSSSFAANAGVSIRLNEVADSNSDELTTRIRTNGSLPFAGPQITPDWIELFNPTADTISLDDYYLTDDADEPFKWQFPAGTNLVGLGYLVVFASGENVTDTQLDETNRLHTNFRLSKSGEYLGLNDSSGQPVSEFSPAFAELREGFSYGLDGSQQGAIFANPTPDAVNDDSSIVAGYVEDTSFSFDRGFYDAPFTTDVTTTTPGATIVYTTDGSEPTLSNGIQVAAANATAVPLASVPISTTTVLRARAFRPGWAETNIDTQTYLFVNDVVQQPALPSGFPATWRDRTADYEVDPEIANNPSYTQDLLDGLRELPALSVSTSVEDLFGTRGIYSRPVNRTLEIAASAELIHSDGSAGFQVDAGFKIQGGASRAPTNSPKHSFSLRFRDSIGPGKLNFPLFEDSPVSTFNSIHLRARFNHSWHQGDESQRNSATYIRDRWMRETMLAMGHVDAGRGEFVHLYLNGLYWGVYDLHERPDASHYAEYFGGDASDYDALNGGEAVDGDLVSYEAMQATVATQNWQAIQQVIDVDNYIDWVILQRYGSNDDLQTQANWRVAGGGANNAPWRFYLWDSEQVFQDLDASGTHPSRDPFGIFESLVEIEEFRIRFSDRVQLHYFNDGALTPANVTQRWLTNFAELRNPIVGESARWGDYRRDVLPADCGCDLYDRDTHWLAANNDLLNNYFPFRSDITFAQLEDLGLYPSVSAALFEIDGAIQHGGTIEAGALLSFDAPGDVYYTLDGTDPRAEGGAAVGTRYRPGIDQPIALTESATVQARVLSGSSWSALSVADFSVPSLPKLAITELHYNPNNPELVDEQTQEFIEIANFDSRSVDLTGVQITQFSNTPYMFEPGTELAPGDYLVVARNPAIFQSIYGTDIEIAPTGYANANLSNGGESIALVSAAGETIVSFTYDDNTPWPDQADGDGPSLEILDPFADPTDASNWRASPQNGGSPGRANLLLGDFDADLDVDGADFLQWQRTFGTTQAVGSLPAWEAYFGEGAQASLRSANAPRPADQLRSQPATETSENSLRQEPNSLAALADAAITWTWLNETEEPVDLPSLASEPTWELVPDFQHTPVEPVLIDSRNLDDFAAADAEASVQQSSDKPWLEQELLDRVFG